MDGAKVEAVVVKAVKTIKTPKKRERKPKILPGWEDRFIDALRDWPNVTRAARKIGVSRAEVYQTCKENADFARRFDEARRLGIDALEDSGFDLARVNPTMMIFMLKNLKPHIYADKHIVETWQDRVITLLREKKVTVEQVASEFGTDIATDLATAAGLSGGAGA